MARLPQPGGDNGNWGTILNNYLSEAHKSDGSLKDDIVTNATIQDGAVTETQLASSVQVKLNATGDWNALANKPTVIGAGSDAAAARSVIGVPSLSGVMRRLINPSWFTWNYEQEVGLSIVFDGNKYSTTFDAAVRRNLVL